jgi:hypothetical protein
MTDRKIIIESSFNERRYDADRLSLAWITRRMRIFMDFTFRSMKQQSNQNFLHLLRYDAESEANLKEALSHYEKLPENIRFVKAKAEYAPAIKDYIKGSKQYFQVRLDSDNMYQSRFIEELHDYQPAETTEVLINQDGYIYEELSQRQAYFRQASPPFYTFLFKTEVYLKGKRYHIPTHLDAIQLRHELLPERNYMVVVHLSNVNNTFDRLHKEMINDPDEIQAILKRFRGE